MSHQFPHAIAIDGPAASGKTTLGRLLAEKLDYLMLDTGGMYRAVTLAVLQRGIDPTDCAGVSAVAERLDIQILPPTAEDDGRLCTVLVDGIDVTWQLRTEQVDRHVSIISAYKSVRAEMVRRQREIAKVGQVVMIGRDIGTVVLPHAPLKLYVTASAEERARRRWLERSQRGDQTPYTTILDGILSRDKIDSTRQHSPLAPAEDALIIDTTDTPPHQVVANIYKQLLATPLA